MMPRPPSFAPTAAQSATAPALGDVKDAPSGELEKDEYSFILDTTLKEKHRADASILGFIDSFIRCKSIQQASAECGIERSVGYRYRHLSDVSNAITKLIEKSSIKYGFDASEIIERTKEIVDFDPINLQNRDGSFKSNLFEIDAESRRSIKKFKAKNLYEDVEDRNGVKTRVIVGELIEVEFYDKLKAIDLVGKEKDLFKNTTKIEHTVSADMANILLESVKRGQQASVDMQTKKIIEIQGTVVNHNLTDES